MSNVSPVLAQNLEGHGELFGWKFEEGGSNGLVAIYIEDDGVWHRKMQFDVYWLEDLELAIKKIKESCPFKVSN